MHTVGSVCLFCCAQIFHFGGKRSRCIFLTENNMVSLTEGQGEWTARPCCSLEAGNEPPGVSHGRESQGESHQDKGCDLVDRDTSLMMSLAIYFLLLLCNKTSLY